MSEDLLIALPPLADVAADALAWKAKVSRREIEFAIEIEQRTLRKQRVSVDRIVRVRDVQLVMYCVPTTESSVRCSFRYTILAFGNVSRTW